MKNAMYRTEMRYCATLGGDRNAGVKEKTSMEKVSVVAPGFSEKRAKNS
jgi:hypothetical protein